jgi:hypothetical protein
MDTTEKTTARRRTEAIAARTAGAPMIVTSIADRVKGSFISMSASLVVAMLYVQAAAERRSSTR